MQKVVMDLDLSNIGCFSQRPSDLIRMGLGVEGQFSGPQFRSNSNLSMLPQIINEVKEIEVDPFWGDDEFCTIGITRVDFDLRDSGIEISPQAVFMGSIYSNSDEDELKVSCKPSINTGALCDMVTQSGRVLAIRQTINSDSEGFPVLEQYQFEQGGNIIDDNGTWLVEVPMNIDYITTNEYGEQILSNDPTIGIPTKGKYRFRIQYQNEDGLNSTILRADYLVPNLKEYGWESSNLNEPGDKDLQLKSYAFSLDWADYGNPTTTLGRQIIQEAIDCEDKFFEFNYNRVYTVSGHIDRWKWGYLPSRILGVKEITERACTATTNRFPTNDANFKFDIIFFVVYFTLGIFYPLIYIFIVVLHVLAWLYEIIVRLWNRLANFWNDNIVALCYKINDVFEKFDWDGFNCDNWLLELIEPQNPFARYSLPMISYPDCDNCQCEIVQVEDELIELYQDAGNFSVLIDSNSVRTYSVYNENTVAQSIRNNDPNPAVTDENFDITNDTLNASIAQGFAGYLGDQSNNKYKLYKTPVVTWPTQFSSSATLGFTETWSQRLNQLNSRDAYRNSNSKIKITVKNINPTTNAVQPSQPFFDQPLIMVCDQGTLSSLGNPGQILSFTKVEDIYDINLTGATLNSLGTNSITGNAAYNPSSLVTRTVNYYNVNPQGFAGSFPATVYLKLTEQTKAYRYKAGIEYFQMVTGGTMQQLQSLIDFQNYGPLQNYVYDHGMKFRWGNGLTSLVQNNFGSAFNGTVHTIEVDALGGIYVGGEFTSYGSVSCSRIIKLDSNGVYDPTFNFGAGFDNTVRTIAIQSDGKIIVGGDFQSYNGNPSIDALVRLNPNGTEDGTFAVSNAFQPGEGVYKVTIQPDGKILVGGSFTSFNTNPVNRLLRLTTLGADDGLSIGTGFDDTVRDVSLQTNGRILVGGDFTLFNGGQRLYAARLLSTGAIDTSFSTTQFVLGTPAINGSVYTIKQTLDGTGVIYIGGDFTAYRGNNVGRIVKTNSAGSPISSFNNSGGLPTQYDFDGVVRVIYNYLDANNVEKLFVGGDFTYYINSNGNQLLRPQIARLNTNGSLDTTFNLNSSWNNSTGTGQGVYTFKRQVDTKVLIGGSFVLPQNYTRITRLLDNGSLNQISTTTTSYPVPYNVWYNVGRTYNALPRQIVSNFNNKEIIILTRGVDPYTEKQKIEYDLSGLFGQPDGAVVVNGDYYMNVPTQLNTQNNANSSLWQVPGVTQSTWVNDAHTPESHLVINNQNPRLFHYSYSSPTVPVGQLGQVTYTPLFQSFTAFTNNSLKYYSSLDKSESSFVSYNGDSYNVSNFTTPSGVFSPLKYNWSQGYNTIGKSWFQPDPPATITESIYLASNLPVGNIEGGTLVASTKSPGATFNIDSTASVFARVFSPAYHLNLNYNYDCTISDSGRLVFRSD
jgi:uncharacterized delta-60 repeat protein